MEELLTERRRRRPSRGSTSSSSDPRPVLVVARWDQTPWFLNRHMVVVLVPAAAVAGFVGIPGHWWLPL